MGEKQISRWGVMEHAVEEGKRKVLVWRHLIVELPTRVFVYVWPQ